MKCKELVKEAGIAWLYEACGEVQSQTKRNHKRKTEKTAESFEIKVDEVNMIGYVGSNYQNAIWEEYGTGEHALHGDGRKGGWWIKVGYGKNEIAPDVVKSYKWVKTRKDADGNITYVFTYGKKPREPFTKAYNALKGKIENRAKEILKNKMVE